MGISKGTNVQDIIRANLYTLSRLEPDDAVKDLAPIIQAVNEPFLHAVALRNMADNAVLKAEGKRDHQRTRLEALLVPFGLKVAAHYGNRTDPGYLRLFPKAPSLVAIAPERDLPGLAHALISAIADKETPTELKKAGAPLVSVAQEYIDAAKAWKATDESLSASIKSLDAAKEKCLDAHAVLRGQLAVRYPRQPKVVARYFQKKNVARKSVKTAVAPVVVDQGEDAQ